MTFYLHFVNNISFYSILFLSLLLLSSITLYSYSFQGNGSTLLTKKNIGDMISIHTVTKDNDNTQKTVFVDKQSNNTVFVLIVANASNPTNKIFYDPSPITIKAGESITWINKDLTIHTVTSGKTDHEVTSYKFDSGMLTFNSTFTHKFDKTGEYYYHCFVHPFMIGKINVIPQKRI